MPESKFKPTQAKTHRIVDKNGVPISPKPIYEQIWTTQQAINMAVAENRVVRFKTTKSNKEIKKEIDDIKGCALRKPDAESNEVAVLPPGVEDFCFEDEIDEKIVIPRPLIYRP